jgi:hypothetical protein
MEETTKIYITKVVSQKLTIGIKKNPILLYLIMNVNNNNNNNNNALMPPHQFSTPAFFLTMERKHLSEHLVAYL